MSQHVLDRLAATIKARRSASADASYTKKLLDGGPARCARKLGEEAVELVVASLAEDNAAVAAEAADVIFHLCALLEVREIPLSAVMDILEARTGTSGLVEKATRPAESGRP